jgi:hypothetical protein
MGHSACGKGGPIGPVQAPRDTPLISAQLRLVAREPYGCFIVEGNPPSGVGGVDSRRKGLQQLLKWLLALARTCLRLITLDSTDRASLALGKRFIVHCHQPLKVRAKDPSIKPDLLNEGPGSMLAGQSLACGIIREPAQIRISCRLEHTVGAHGCLPSNGMSSPLRIGTRPASKRSGWNAFGGTMNAWA